MKLDLFGLQSAIPKMATLTGALLLATLGTTAHPGTAPTAQAAQAPSEGVKLHLATVKAERFAQDVLFDCDATLINRTGTTIQVKSNFSSAFDGLELIVFDEHGKRLVQQPYIWHQSPYSFLNPRTFDLKPGANQQPLTFPIRDLPSQLKTLRVLLVGTLPGSTYEGVLCSDVVTVSITARPEH
ncbi:MAG: hypothetical protein JO316_01060 [Abitibacteriaceae bacterium]|nr:hypothetical protein [Abditibacteriaceae bacterium]MBV9863918.1 hypothetical protein [Abditibacteriaceae bacterium]